MKFNFAFAGSGLSIELNRLPKFQSVPYYLKRLAVDRVLDVGSNRGQFIREIRDGGYRGKITGFEPLPEEFERLRRACAPDKRIRLYPYALGNASQKAELNFGAAMTNLASLLPASETFEAEWGDMNSRSVTVEVRRLDDLWREAVEDSKKIFLKIDTQGNDLAVLEGCGRYLDAISGIQAELSIKPLYRNQKTLLDTVQFLRERNFHLRLIKPVVASKKGELLEVDGVFLKAGEEEILH